MINKYQKFSDFDFELSYFHFIIYIKKKITKSINICNDIVISLIYTSKQEQIKLEFLFRFRFNIQNLENNIYIFLQKKG